jgi:hypothetical protein
MEKLKFSISPERNLPHQPTAGRSDSDSDSDSDSNDNPPSVWPELLNLRRQVTEHYLEFSEVDATGRRRECTPLGHRRAKDHFPSDRAMEESQRLYDSGLR